MKDPHDHRVIENSLSGIDLRIIFQLHTHSYSYEKVSEDAKATDRQRLFMQD